MLTVEIIIRRGDTTLLSYQNNALTTFRWDAAPDCEFFDPDGNLAGFCFVPFSSTGTKQLDVEKLIEISELKVYENKNLCL